MAADARAFARLVAMVALLLGAVALAWFGWIDAPITDGAMVLVAVGLLFAVLAAGAALLSLEAGLAADATASSGAASGGASARWRRLALALLLAALLVLAVAAVVTLNLRGSGADDAGDEQATATKHTLTRA
jgi:hypothetical protein